VEDENQEHNQVRAYRDEQGHETSANNRWDGSTEMSFYLLHPDLIFWV